MPACAVSRYIAGALAVFSAGLLASCGTLKPRAASLPSAALSAAESENARGLAHYLQGLLYEYGEGRDSTNALDHFAQAAAIDPREPRLYSRVAAMALLQGRPELAISTLENSCRADPDSVESLLDLATVYQITGQTEAAIGRFQQAVDLAPANPTACLALANVLFFDGRPRQALSVLAKGFRRIGPAVGRPLVGFAYAQGARLTQSGDTASALSCLKFVARHFPEEQASILVLMGQIHEEQGNTAEAIRCYRNAIATNDPPPQAFVRLALALLHSDAGKAVEVLNDAHRRLPDDILILLALGQIYNTQNRMEAAVATFDEIAAKVDAKPSSRMTAGFYLQYGALCERAGQSDKAEKILIRGIELYPSAHEILNYLAYTWAEKGIRLDEARDYVTRALEQAPDNGAYIDTLGWIYFQQKKYAEAVEQLEKAAKLMKDDPTITDHLGDAYDAAGQRDRALLQWRLSYALDPENKAVAAKLRANGINPVDVLKESPPEKQNSRPDEP